MIVTPTEPVTVGVLAFQGLILAVFLVALWRRNGAAIVNAVVAFGITLLPPMVERGSALLVGDALAFGPELTLWLAVAGGLHAVGMLGPYDTVWWWDHLTHTVSAGFVAALIYAGLVGLREAGVVGVSLDTIGLVTIGATFVAGVFWELLELLARDLGDRYGVDPVLVYYGRRDMILDLVFNTVGAVLVVAVNLQLFVPATTAAPQATQLLLVGSGVLIAAGSLVLVRHLARGSGRGHVA
ncbi:hypothetical protein OB905_10700 [Halobacteria archaeon AArc-dxtr1]|nr:hypothetical protein [Halobacteria archaeon AArc-dxtr1]